MTRRPWIAVPAWIATLLAGLAVLARPSSPALAAPPLRDPAMWSDWAAGRTPVEVGLAVIRVLAVGAGWYLVAVTVLAVLARLSGRARLLRMSDLVTIPVASEGGGIEHAHFLIGPASQLFDVPVENSSDAPFDPGKSARSNRP